MKYLYICSAVFCAILITPISSMAQEKTVSTPLFITPYTASVPTYTNRVPTMVQPNRTSRTYTQPNRKSKPMYDTNVNQFPADFGRITGEQDFYDSQTKRYYGQYEYFELLAQRGDTAKLQQVVGDVQRTGVFDPAKYQAIMSGGSNGGGMTGINNGGGMPQRQIITRQKTPTVTRQNQVVTPKRVHQGYDDDMESTQTSQPVQQARPKNAPIFLR